jgi:hypothetical protein
MKYIVIENWENLSSPQLCVNEEGETLVFDKLEDAKAEAYSCHEGVVIPLCKDLMDIIQDAYDKIGMAKYELGEDFDEGGEESVEGLLGMLKGY